LRGIFAVKNSFDAPSRKTQRQQVLDVLLATEREVPISLQCNARVKELRQLGFHITTRVERQSGQVHGFFQLHRGMNAETLRGTLRAAVYPKVPSSHALPVDTTPSLFGDPGREAWIDPEERR
jgi:hypothetical protein